LLPFPQLTLKTHFFFCHHEIAKDSEQVLPLLQQENRAESQAHIHGNKKGDDEKRLKGKGKEARLEQGHRQQGKILEACRLEIQEKIQDDKKDKHNVHMLCLRKIQIQAGKKK
jgi:hypothetical protein